MLAAQAQPDAAARWVYEKHEAEIGHVPLRLFGTYNQETHALGDAALRLLLALDTPQARVLEPTRITYTSRSLEQLGFTSRKLPEMEDVRKAVMALGGTSCHQHLALSIWRAGREGMVGRFLMYPVEVEAESLIWEIQADAGKRHLRGIDLKHTKHWDPSVPVIFQV